MAGELTPTAVIAEVERVMSGPWEWGTLDCTTAAADVFLALYGVDPMGPVRGRYNSATGAARLIRQWGGMVSMGEQLSRIAGLVVGDGLPGEIGISRRGAAEGLEGRAALICIQPGAWAAKTPGGFAVLPNAERSWRV